MSPYSYVRRTFDLGVGKSAEAFTGTGLPPVPHIRGLGYDPRNSLVLCTPAPPKFSRSIGPTSFLGTHGQGLTGTLHLQGLALRKG